VSEHWSYGWISGSGTFAYAPSVTGTGYSPVPVMLTLSAGCLTVTRADPGDWEAV
jgi:hypothetical protein